MEDQVFSCVHGIVRKRGVVRAHAMGLKPGLAPRLLKEGLYKVYVGKIFFHPAKFDNSKDVKISDI